MLPYVTLCTFPRGSNADAYPHETYSKCYGEMLGKDERRRP
jgi:hypothetical protein